jgi:putative hydrolase of the HAD superfamily
VEGHVRAVLFDAGNTLIYVHPERVADILRAAGAPVDAAGVREAERAARRRLHDVIDDGQLGTEPEVWRAYFSTLFRRSGVPAEGMEQAGRMLRDTHAHDHLWTWVEEGTVEALEALAAAGYRLAVISNADGRVESVLRDVGLARHFEFVMDSEVVGVSKPDPTIFLEGCRRLGLAPEACLYVGDLYPVDYVGATGAGLHGVLLDPLALHRGRAPRVSTLGEIESFLSNGLASGGPAFPQGPTHS